MTATKEQRALVGIPDDCPPFSNLLKSTWAQPTVNGYRNTLGQVKELIGCDGSKRKNPPKQCKDCVTAEFGWVFIPATQKASGL